MRTETGFPYALASSVFMLVWACHRQRQVTTACQGQEASAPHDA
jgi:hypothetical protein